MDNAILLAAGFGTRFVPFTYDTPKGLLKVKGKPMIERQIEQLHEADIKDVTIVVGYLKEKFDYLVDKYGVKLVFNPEYAEKNNYVSVYYVRERLKNTYLLVADTWTEENIFHTWEPCSWACCLYYHGATNEWGVSTGANGFIKSIDTSGKDTWALNGPAYFTKDFSKSFSLFIEEAYKTPGTENYYWEHILKNNLKKLPIYANFQSSQNLYEFEDLDTLRDFDQSYNEATGNMIMQEIAGAFDVREADITGIEPLKEGVTNNSFLFRIEGDRQRYVFRKPGIGTDKLIDRKNEKKVYELLTPLNIADEIIYFNSDNGNRVTKFWEEVHVSDPFNDNELEIAMQLLRFAHEKKLVVDRIYNMPGMIDYYINLCSELGAIRFSDFDRVFEDVKVLLRLRERLAVPEVLCHGDYVYGNALIFPDGSSRLIDWEYGGMADPVMDVAMFDIFSYFDRDRIDLSLRLYLGREPEREESARLYMYTALSGFQWSLWAEYKQALGQEFGEYPLIMYRYMKDYYRVLKDGGFLEEQ